MKLNFIWFATMIGILVLANVLMALGYINKQASMQEDFMERFTNPNPAPSLVSGEYVPIGTYDNLPKQALKGEETKKTAPLNGPEFSPDQDHLFLFASNQSKPECCGESYTSSSGCVCITPGQRDLLAKRGGNNTAPESI
jgi:hypothetical protein